jgi:hypothetical protein
VKPSIGRIVHYVSYGTPGGEFLPEHRAAIVTAVHLDDHTSSGGELQPTVDLCVLNPTGLFFNQRVAYNHGRSPEGSPDCPNRSTHGNPFRYCQCGWMEAGHRSGTWHWPEREEEEA